MPTRRIRQILVLIFLAACAGWYIRETIWLELPGLNDDNSDFHAYHRAARAIVAGHSPYSLGTDYIYPPAMAFLVTPLAPFDYVTARRIFFGVSQVFLIAAAVLLWYRCGRDWAAARVIAFVWAIGDAGVEALGLGQTGPLLTLLLVVVYTETGWLQGAASALCFGVKLFPGIVALALLLRRERFALAGLVAGIIAFAVVPSLVIAGWLPGPKTMPKLGAWAGTPATLSWSLPSVVLRILDPPKAGGPLPQSWVDGVGTVQIRPPAAHQRVSAGVALAVLLAGCLAVVAAVRFRATPAQVPWIAAALTSLVLAVSPISWTHYQVTQYPGVAMLLLADWRCRRWVRVALTLGVAALLYPVPVAILRAYYERYGGWTAASPATLFIWTSITPLACLVLFAMLLRQARQPRPAMINGNCPADELPLIGLRRADSTPD